MNLLIDAGNSRIKWMYGKKLPSYMEAVSYRIDWQKKLYLSWHLLPEPQFVMLSSVNSEDVEIFISNLVKKLWNKQLYTVTATKETKNPYLKIAYKKPHTLGTDRYLAMLGARQLTNDGFCVIGCGTALTLDVVDKGGFHRGGLILPGMRLCENSLLKHTKRLQPMRWTSNILGEDTAGCVGAGIHHALPIGIESIIRELEESMSTSLHRYAFGGDASILFNSRAGYSMEPDLVFRGMLKRLDDLQ